MSVQSRSMKTRPRRSSVYISASLIVVALVALSAIAAGARNWLTPRPSAVTPAPPAHAYSSPQQGAHKRSQMEAEIITITPRGFEPAEITRPKGAFILVVDNRSDLEEVNFRLGREAGDRLKEVRAPREHPDWDEVVDLTPGSYVLTEADHPDWLCRINITAQ